MDEEDVYSTWLCSSALTSLVAFLAVPKFAWGVIFSLIFGWVAYKGLVNPKSRRILLIDGICNAAAGLVLFTLALLGLLTVKGRVVTVTIFLCASAFVCFHIFRLEGAWKRAAQQ